MQVAYSKEFRKRFVKYPKKLQLQFAQRLSLYLHEPQHPLLHVHQLSGKMKQCQSFNVTADIRAVFTIRDAGETLYIEMVGTHSQLYG